MTTDARAVRPVSRMGPWVRFLGRRLLSLAAVLLGLAIATFLMVRLVPGDPVVLVAGEFATEEQMADVRHQLGLDLPPLEQLGSYLSNTIRGDLGKSFLTHSSVSQVIGERIGASLQLAGAALLLVLLVSVPLGMTAAAHTREGRNRLLEVAITGFGSVLGALPEYVTATFLAFLFAVWLRLLPVAGSADWTALVLPTLAVSLRPIAVLTRVVRVETLNVLASDYMRTARSKRLPTWHLYARHALPNVVTGALTIGALLFAGLIGGAVVVENVFARPGLGTALVAALLGRDYPVIQGIMLVLGVTVVSVNALTDVGLAILDPRSLGART